MDFEIIVTAMTLFISTNFDDMTWLPIILLAYKNRMRDVFAGYLCASLFLYATCEVLANIISGTPDAIGRYGGYIGNVGFLFILYAIIIIYKWATAQQTNSSELRNMPSNSQNYPFIASFITVFSNSANNLIILIPTFIMNKENSLKFVLLLWAGNIVLALISLATVRIFCAKLATTSSKYSDPISAAALLLLGVKVIAQ